MANKQIKELRCVKCDELMFRLNEETKHGETIGKIYGKWTEFLTSQGIKKELECKCPQCEGINTLYFSKEQSGNES